MKADDLLEQAQVVHVLQDTEGESVVGIFLVYDWEDPVVLQVESAIAEASAMRDAVDRLVNGA